MHVKRYCRPTMREALRAVREELGPSALVLSTRAVSRRGIRGWMGATAIEVTAAVDRPVLSERRMGRPADRSARRSASVVARLEASGMESPVARQLADHPALRRRGADAVTLRKALAEQLAPLIAANDAEVAVEVFIGPPGVGKTTTIAKIAAQARARHTRRLGLIAADGFRVGAVEQLRLFADIIGSPFAIARSGAELAAVLDKERRPLLVDTAGRSPGDAASADMLEALVGRPGVRRHLVLPAGMPAHDARRVISRFGAARPDRIVLTRLDEIETLAPLIGVLRDCQLPISYLAHGQNVPEDLQRATSPALARWVLGEAPSGASA